MSDLQQKIDEILSERKSRIDKISSQSELIGSLYPNLEKIQKTISELGVEGADEKAKTIEAFLTHLDQAREKLRLLKKRYAKDTINIGVSGFTHAGKSTLLQAISGLSDNEIPKAKEGDSDSLHATTAICSQIFNSQEKYAEVFYKTDKEFVDFVNAHLEMAGISTISDKGEFPNVQIPENKDTEEEKNTIKDRLRLLQESFPFYKDKIGNGYEKISGNNLDRLVSYVSYSKKDKMTRFFPAVKEVKIYCKFPALDNPDVKLCLVDLPGFGEFDKVDKIQIDNLKEIVDHIIFIYKTNKDEAIVNKKYRESYLAIKGIHPAQSSNAEFLLNFLSFFINEDRTNEYWQNHVSQAIKGITDSYGNYKYYNFPAWFDGQTNKPDAEKNLNDILTRLSQTLPQMDECLLKSLGESLNVSEILFLLKDLAQFVSQYSYQNDDPTKFHSKGLKFRRELYRDIDKLLQKYIAEKDSIDGDFIKQLTGITEKTEKEIDETLLYTQINKESAVDWDEYIELEKAGGYTSTFPKELRRIWVEIMNRYVELDADFGAHINKLKNEIADIFDRMSGSIIPKTDNGYNLKGFVDDKLSVLNSDNAIYKAFGSLETLNQNFRQNLYPFIFKDNLDKLMYVENEGGVQKLKEGLLTIESYKQQLVNICKNMNYEISKGIKRNFILSYFLIGALQTFLEKISNLKTDTDADFVHFCSIFRRSIYPDEYGNEADSIKVQELSTLIQQTEEIISKF